MKKAMVFTIFLSIIILSACKNNVINTTTTIYSPMLSTTESNTYSESEKEEILKVLTRGSPELQIIECQFGTRDSFVEAAAVCRGETETHFIYETKSGGASVNLIAEEKGNQFCFYPQKGIVIDSTDTVSFTLANYAAGELHHYKIKIQPDGEVGTHFIASSEIEKIVA